MCAWRLYWARLCVCVRSLFCPLIVCLALVVLLVLFDTFATFDCFLFVYVFVSCCNVCVAFLLVMSLVYVIAVRYVMCFFVCAGCVACFACSV